MKGWLGASAVVALGVVAWVIVGTVQPLARGSRTPVLSATAVQSAAAQMSPAPPRPASVAPPAREPVTGRSRSPRPIRTETFRVDGGVVTVGCDGSTATLRSAQPEDGWRLDVGSRGPQAVDVGFTTAERESELKVSCPGGSPVRVADS